MKRILLPSILMLVSSVFLAQGVGINNSGANPANSAMLDVVATDKGILVPRVALTATNAAGPITAPATSLLVYNTATAGAAPNNVTPGFYYWNSAAWQRFDTDNNTGDWKILGNANTVAGTNFLGTTNAQHLDFRTNNVNRMRIMDNAYPVIGIGTAFPVANLSGNSAVLHVHDGGTSVGSQLVLSTHSTANNSRVGIVNFASTQTTNNRIVASVESNLTAASGTNATGDLRFLTNNNNSLTEKMRIEGDGDVGIGATPDASAKLDVSATNRGLLAPRVALTATNAAGPIAAPATSLLVYNTATAGVAPNNVIPGYYYNSGTPGAPIWTRFMNGNGNPWLTNGNAGTIAATNFVGTSDNIALRFRTNNLERFEISTGTAATGGHLRAFNDGTAAAPVYSWNTDTDIGMYRIGDNTLGVSTSGIERMRVQNNGVVRVNLFPIYLDDRFSVQATTADAGFAIGGYTNQVGNAIFGRSIGNTVLAAIQGEYDGTNGGSAGVRGAYTTNGAGTSFLGAASGVNGQADLAGTYKFGVLGTNAASSSVRTGGVIGNNANWSRGACGYYAANGADYGIYGFGIAYQQGIATGMNPSLHNEKDLVASNNGLIGIKNLKYYKPDNDVNTATWSNNEPNAMIGMGIYGGVMGGWIKGLVYGTNLSGAKYGLYVHGKTITNNVITTLNNVPGTDKRTVTYATMAMKVEITDKGKASISNGKASIEFSEDFSKIISSKEPVIISVTPLGSSKGFYVVSSDVNGFTVMENEGGNSNIEFYWMAIGVKNECENVTISPEIISNNFEDKINGNQGVMFNDNNPQTPKYSLWFDGKEVRFDTPPTSHRKPIDLGNSRSKP